MSHFSASVLQSELFLSCNRLSVYRLLCYLNAIGVLSCSKMSIKAGMKPERCISATRFVSNMAQEYISIQKGSGYVYACAKMLYHRVKTKGNVKYLKCSHENCDRCPICHTDIQMSLCLLYFYVTFCTVISDFLH